MLFETLHGFSASAVCLREKEARSSSDICTTAPFSKLFLLWSLRSTSSSRSSSAGGGFGLGDLLTFQDGDVLPEPKRARLTRSIQGGRIVTTGGRNDTTFFIASNHDVFTMRLLGRVWEGAFVWHVNKVG